MDQILENLRLGKAEVSASDCPEMTPSGQQLSYHPVVRYGNDTESGDTKQEPRLRSIHESIPEDAVYASPVYLLDERQAQRLDELWETPYAIEGQDNNIAQDLQTECERTGRVLYPVYVETDALGVTDPDRVSVEIASEWIYQFITNTLRTDISVCSFYHSGSRSIHAHVPKVVTEDQIGSLRELASTFNERFGAQLDVGIYSRKRQFRLPGVVHAKTGMPKVRLATPLTAKCVAQAIANPEPISYATYADLLADVFDHDIVRSDVLHGDTSEAQLGGLPESIVTAIFGKGSTLVFEKTEQEEPIEVPLIEQSFMPIDPSNYDRWSVYNQHAFSPYATSGGRSIAMLTVEAGAFCRTVDGEPRTFLPAHVHAAVGRNGEFTVFQSYRPVQLSKTDFEKRDYEVGEHLVIIGGGNRSSIIHSLPATDAINVSMRLKDSGRAAVLDYLEVKGYHIGEAGPAAPRGSESSEPSTMAEFNRVLPVEKITSEASEFQRRAETGDIDFDLSHNERWRLAQRLLAKYGWQMTWDWFREQYAERFDPDVTHQQLSSAVNANPGIQRTVKVPAR